MKMHVMMHDEDDDGDDDFANDGHVLGATSTFGTKILVTWVIYTPIGDVHIWSCMMVHDARIC